MKLLHDSAPCLFHLLLLAELFVPASSSLCGTFGPMVHQVEKLRDVSQRLHELSDSDVLLNSGASRLPDLPHVQHTAHVLHSLKVNQSLSELVLLTHSFRLHVHWLKTEKDNFSLPSQAAEDASTQLLLLSTLLDTSLLQIGEEPPRPPAPSLPVVSSAFDLLQFSVEISERLRVFCNWSKRVLRRLQKLSRCRRH